MHQGRGYSQTTLTRRGLLAKKNRLVINFRMHIFNLSACCALPNVLSVSGLLCCDGIFLDETSESVSPLPFVQLTVKEIPQQ